jgi:hypothetical protein
MFFEMIAGAFPYPTYPFPGLAPTSYPPPNAAALSSVNPVLAEVTLGLIRWIPGQRMTLAEASARLEPLSK